MNTNTTLSDKWLKAAVIAGLWASIEIVIGSFLHNMRIPFAGTILASQGILILIAFNQIWKENGIIIRAGIITALMKSISPSSVILGPMIGIFAEALLLEIFLILFNRGYLGAVLGAAAALSSALIHKIASVIILYGWDITLIYLNIYNYFQKALQIEFLSAKEFILLVFAVYFGLGAIVGIIGILIGRKAKSFVPNSKIEFQPNFKVELFPLSGKQPYNLFLLFLGFIFIPIGLYLINKNVLLLGLPFLTLFALLAFWRYDSIFRRLEKPIFWGQLLVIILLSGFFFTDADKSNQIFNLKGIVYGIEMSLRALFIVLVFTLISIELRNPRIKQFLYSHQLGGLHQSLSFTFSSLPLIVKMLPPVKEFFQSPLRTLSILVAHNVEWYNSNNHLINKEFAKKAE
ncbi:MAG TPA: hypothetical protein DCG69_02255 [Bacteroidales bacterium]|nr:hypothetical protein [Bacteroidales bacterium]